MKNAGERRREVLITSCLSPVLAPTFRDHEGTRTLILTDRHFTPLSELPKSVYDRILLQEYAASEVRAGFLVTVSRGGDWLVSQAVGEAAVFFNNLEYGCQHAEPRFNLYPEEERIVEQKLYFLLAKPEQLLECWRKDFGLV